ncbi:DNA polymerase I [Sphingomicrobium astaxanthinifaciens]|uniref:DNA polymerase I n=1 Tax=Sphingomicrobium astaxanthinifaciens TaxID=1227949 RepID=UPI001FCB8BC5|nr:DNA polymerase I [Sphingomicrobium astaxanthinifaciens]MCJ7421227.1 DNA polymerase I [Sphingomicrobium astaxanthinifaciens]
MADQPHLYLVDGSSYIFRAYHVLPPITNKAGIPAGAVYGYTAMLWKLADGLNKEDGPSHLAVILDASGKTHRDELFEQYKANRPPAPEDLVPQFPLVREATRAFSLPCIEEEGLEADDIIACYARAAADRGWRVTIVSSDKDLMQLIETRDNGADVDMLDTMKDKRIRREDVIEKFGVPPEKVGDLLAMMGDKVDNVPGVPGVGPKTAAQLLEQYGDLDTILSSLDKITKPALKRNLTEHADNARLSRQLVELICDHPLPQPLEELKLDGIPAEPLRAFLEEQGFKRLLERMGGGSKTEAERGKAGATGMDSGDHGPADPPEPEKISVDRSKYETITDMTDLERWILAARHVGHVAIDTETDCLDCVTGELVGISLAVGPDVACYIPLGHGGADLLGERPDQLDKAEVLAKLKPLLEDAAVLKVGHNLKYDLAMFSREGIRLAPYDDTLVMSFNLDAGRGLQGHGLDTLAKQHFEHECIPFKAVCGTGRKQISFAEVPLDKATEYAAEDADIALRLWQRLKPRMAPERAARVYERVDRPMPEVLAKMELRGIKVDRARLASLSKQFAEDMAALEKQIYAAAGEEFTIGSPQQLGHILFEKLGAKGGRKGKSGNYSTDQSELERLASEGFEVATKVLEWRQLSKLKSTYTDALQEQINASTGRVHTSYSLAGAQTGRLSSNDPNLQNIPIRTPIGAKIRDCFVAEEGHVLLSADYSQIELRLAAHMADVPQLKEAFNEGEDIHDRTATELFGEVMKETRGKAKTVNFAILYGISAFGLANRLDIGRDEAKAIIDTYFQRFPGIQNYIARTTAEVKETGFTTTLFGRKTHFPNINSRMPNVRAGAERAAVNAPIQGTSADLIKRAMARMDEALAEAGLDDVKMLLQVHDELLFEVPAGREEAAAAVIRPVMEGAAAPALVINVPLEVEIGWGANWGAAH